MRQFININDKQFRNAVTLTTTSSRTAETSPILLRDATPTTRLYFDPLLVRNSTDPGNVLEGKIVYERKGKNEQHFPTDLGNKLPSKGSIRKGDSLELTLNSSETKTLYLALHKLYALAGSLEYMPYGSSSYVEVSETAHGLLGMLKKDPSVARMLVAEPENLELVEELFRLLTLGTSRDELQHILEELDTANLQELSSGINLQQLKSAANDIQANLENSQEEFWQSQVFSKYQWIISQLFSSPCVLFSEKAYVGGKTIDNWGGNVVDFIYQNKLTKNVSLVEIKTPCTPILGKPYRQQVRSLSREMSGAVNQVLNYRQSLEREYAALTSQTQTGFSAFSPKCVVIIGNTAEFMTDGIRDNAAFSTFENYRNSLNGITIVTYDELLEKIKSWIDLLQTASDTPDDAVNDSSEDVPS